MKAGLVVAGALVAIALSLGVMLRDTRARSEPAVPPSSSDGVAYAAGGVTAAASQRPVAPSPARSQPAPSAPPVGAPAVAPLERVEPQTQRVPFPTNVRQPFTPEGFAEVLSRAVADCKLPLSELRSDCSEYPCLAVGRWDHTQKPEVDLSDCAPWHEAFGDKTMVIARAAAQDGTMQMALLPLPDEEAELKLARRRARSRVDALFDGQSQAHN